jgi:amidophosphoribosyltransferase
MEKQHNRGQDGAGVANIKLDMQPGERYISRVRSVQKAPIQDIFDQINTKFKNLYESDPDSIQDVDFLKRNVGFTGELFFRPPAVWDFWKKLKGELSSIFKTKQLDH